MSNTTGKCNVDVLLIISISTSLNLFNTHGARYPRLVLESLWDRAESWRRSQWRFSGQLKLIDRNIETCHLAVQDVFVDSRTPISDATLAAAMMMKCWGPFHQQLLHVTQIKGKFRFAVAQFPVARSLQNYSHATIAQLSCHLPLAVIIILDFEEESNETAIAFKLRWDIFNIMGPGFRILMW